MGNPIVCLVAITHSSVGHYATHNGGTPTALSPPSTVGSSIRGSSTITFLMYVTMFGIEIAAFIDKLLIATII